MSCREYMEWLAYFRLESGQEPAQSGGGSWRNLKHALLRHFSIVKKGG